LNRPRRCRPRFTTRFAYRLGLNLANRVLQRQALTGDLGFGERRVDAAQLRYQSGAGALIKRAPRFGGIVGKPLYGAGDEWMIICHRRSLRCAH
jgi:hypothetical protein